MSASLPTSLSGESAHLPSGTVTFVFTDIEGSTRRWDTDRAAMENAVRAHDAIVREAVRVRGGAVFKTIGDAFCTAFNRAGDAVAAALDAQRALAAYDFSPVGGLKVRIALHTGTADERDGDYFGGTVNRVARLLAIGHGGQVLLSGVTADLVAGELPPRATLRDLGQQRLKDLAHPEWVYQLVAPDLEEDFPVLRSLTALPNNLPLQLTSFVGRERVVGDIVELVGSHRLVTLVGTGGIGKTRISLQVGADLLDGSGDGVWFIELAPLRDGSLIPSVIAAEIGLSLPPGREPLAALITALRSKRMLVILDNCEHLIEDAARVADAILRGSPESRILASSRQGLGISGEETYRIPSLTSPGEHDVATLTAYEAQQYGGIRLFCERALSVDKQFALTDENAPHVAEIVARLDGIALAIELAAARVKVLSIKNLAQRLDERFRILTGGSRTALPRQQTMRALIDWSYELLSETERAFFRKLAIFAGGFTLDLAVRACADEALADFEILDILTSLVDKSLVQVERTNDDTRYRLLESTRQYAHEKLVERGEYEPTARAHALAYLELASRLDESWHILAERAWRAAVEPELENFRAALGWAFGPHGERRIGESLTAALGHIWGAFGAPEGARWCRYALAGPGADVSPDVAVQLLVIEADLLAMLTQLKASLVASERALALLDGLDAPTLRARAERCAAQTAAVTRQVVRPELLESALAVFRERGMRKEAAITLQKLAWAKVVVGSSFSEAERLSEEALAIDRSLGYETGIATLCSNLAESAFHVGRYERALTLAREGLEIDRARSNRSGIALALCNMSAYLVACERWEEAHACGAEGLPLSRETGHDVGLSYTLQHLAAVAALRTDERADRERAARILGYVDARLRELDAVREKTEQLEYDRIVAALADLPSSLATEGARWTEDQAIGAAI